MMQLKKSKLSDSKESNKRLSDYASDEPWLMQSSRESEKQKDMQFQINKLIENAKTSLVEYENYSSKKATGSINSAVSAVYADKLEPAQTEYISNTGTAQILQRPQESEPVCKIELARDPKKSVIVCSRSIEEVMGLTAVQIARDIGANCVISVEKMNSPTSEDVHGSITVQVSIFKLLDQGEFSNVKYCTKMRKVMSGSIMPTKELLMEAVSKKHITKGDRIVCIEDESLGMGYRSLLLVFDVDQIFFNMSMMNLTDNIPPEILETVINIAIEIGKEGREGRHIGTAFIIGKREELIPNTKQMVLNPFAGHPEEERKITNPEMKETIKNYAQLDGVFIVDDKGVVVTAGAHITVDASEVKMPGFGTRHRCCAAITKKCNAVAVVVSESGGTMSIFKSGELVMRLP